LSGKMANCVARNMLNEPTKKKWKVLSCFPDKQIDQPLCPSRLRRKLEQALPILRDPLKVRRCMRSGMDLLSRWPEYPESYNFFNFSFAHLDPSEMDSFFEARQRQEDRMVLVVDYGDVKSIGYLALIGIDWASRRCSNMGIRVHPEWWGRGVGVGMLATVRDWWFANGMTGLRLDVASSNARAVRCYEKVGFVKIGELWRESPDLRGVNLAESKWRFLDGHVRTVSSTPESHFLLMELKPG
jgi:RimJ/RimL family protein N-acetyltransferase